MAKSMMAAVSRTVGANPDLETVTLADPGPGEVRVALGASAVCHSDLSYVDGHWKPELPAVWGHEAAGVVEAVGPGSGRLPRGGTGRPPCPGDRVAVSLVRSCGECRSCRAGNEVGCTGEFALSSRSPLSDESGAPIVQGLGTAAFAEAVVVHRSQVVGIPDELGMPAASLLGCGVLTGVGAVRRSSPVAEGQTVVVVGAGGVGLSAIQGSRLAGAGHIVALDPESARRDLAIALGAHQALDPTGFEPEALAAHLSADLGHLADQVIVTTGAPSALTLGESLVGAGGALVIVGMPADGVGLTIDPSALAAAGKRIVGSKMGSARIASDIPWLAEQFLAGRLDLDSMIGRTLSLADIGSALDDMRDGRGARSVITFDGGPE